ncbi:hypothetical protein [Streptomyces cinereoruber]|uniref:hypothetical protein n=1 Tax=Streptomyces cinereoruber TaxID=67260 RepID=UPI003636DC70
MYPTLIHTPGLRRFTYDLDAERQLQLAKWGDQRHPDGTGRPGYIEKAAAARAACQTYAVTEEGGPRWSLILLEEVYEALAETDRARLRAELVQVAAVCAAWVRDIDQRPMSTPDAEAVTAAAAKLRAFLAPGGPAEEQAAAAYAAALDQEKDAVQPSDVETARAHTAGLLDRLTEQERLRLDLIAAAIYRWNNPKRAWDEAHPHDRICYSGDAYAALTALRETDDDPAGRVDVAAIDTATHGEPFVPRTERQYWQDIADALNAALTVGMPVGIDLDGTLTDHTTWSVVWSPEAERWEVAGYEDDAPVPETDHAIQPAERCGHQPDPVIGRPTECVLRPGHSGSHADHTGMRWWMHQTPALGLATQSNGLAERQYEDIERLQGYLTATIRALGTPVGAWAAIPHVVQDIVTARDQAAAAVARVRAWCDDLDASVRLQHGDPHAEHPHAIALRLILDPQEGP